MAKRLTQRQARFVAEYISGKTGAQAAIDAGYSTHNARNTANELLTTNALVQAEVEKARAELRTTANYNAERAFADLQAAQAFAEKTGNATAFARCVELKAKLMGLMDTKDKDGGKTANLQFNFVGVSVPDAKAVNNG